MTNIIAQGAEAIITRQGDQVVKFRLKKSYRLPQLDKKLRTRRTKKEAKLLEKLQSIIPVPKLIFTNLVTNQITMQFINGEKLSEHLEQLNYKEICKQIGNQITKLHDNNIIHGDLTTSNMIYVSETPLDSNSNNKPKNDLSINKVENNSGTSERKPDVKKTKFKIYFIDFGLSFHSTKIEDRAVDIHLLKQALEAKHFKIAEQCTNIILKNYNSKDKTKVLEQLKKVEARGRYKH